MTAPLTFARTQRAELAKAARREEILAAARRVFGTRGFSGTTIADIADDAGIALGTIYLYFSSKEEVFAGVHQQLTELIAAALTDVPRAVSVEETVRRRIDNVFAACADNRDLVRLVVLNTDPESDVAKRLRSAADERDRPMVRVVEEAMARGLVRNADAQIMTKLVRGLVTIAVYQTYVVSDGEDADRYRDACADMVLAYMQPPSRTAKAQFTGEDRQGARS